MSKETIVVWISCGAASGAASGVAGKKTLELYGKTHNIRMVNNPVIEEDEDNRRFLRDLEKWYGVKIEQAINPDFPSCSIVSVFDRRKAMSFPTGAPCTGELKKRARQHWEKHNHADHHVLGFTLDEQNRHERFVQTERELLPVLINERITKADCYRIIMEAGLELPRVYRMGYPNANCIGCVKATSPTYWNHVRKHHPDVFDARARQSDALGVRLVRVNNKRIPLTQLDPNAKGRPLKSMDFECGIFCEEKLSA